MGWCSRGADTEPHPGSEGFRFSPERAESLHPSFYHLATRRPHSASRNPAASCIRRESRDVELFEIPLSGTSQPKRVSGLSSTLDEHTPHYSPDGERLAFASTRSGTEEIWIANSDGTNPLKMTSMGGPQCSNPQWSPDGKRIVFNSRREGTADLYILQPDTGEVRRITHDPSEEIEPRWSRDGQWIYFGSNKTGRFEVWRMPGAGGVATQITRQGGADGHRISGRKLPLLRQRLPIADDDLACAGWWRHGNPDRGSFELFE